MRRTLYFTICFLASSLLSMNANADVVLTFDQSGIFDSVLIDQNYGDRVTASPDGNGHAYDIITGNGLGTTPNVEVSYSGESPDLWTTGYGDLTNVFYNELDFSTGFGITLTADAGFEVGLFGFDMAAFGLGEVLPGVEVLDGDDNVLWSASSVAIDGTNRNSFDTGGVFADSLTISIDLTGLGGGSDNIGIDNVHFGQRVSAIPEPAGASVFFAGLLGLLGRRNRRRPLTN